MSIAEQTAPPPIFGYEAQPAAELDELIDRNQSEATSDVPTARHLPRVLQVQGINASCRLLNWCPIEGMHR
jgi:hypothetical protein